MYLFDTNVLLELTARRPNRPIIERLKRLVNGSYNTSSVVLMEIRHGTARHPDPEGAWKNVEDVILPNLTVLDFTRAEALKAGDIDATLRQRGRTPPRLDLMIGATALKHGLILVTRNVRDFMEIPGLAIENWFV